MCATVPAACGKWPLMAPYDVQRSNCLIAAHHGHHRHGAITAGQQILRTRRQFLRRLVRVSKIDFAPVKDGCAGDKLVRQRQRKALPQGFDTGLVRPANSGELDQIAVWKRNGQDRVREQVQAAAHDGVKDRLRVGRRVADDLENFRRRGLPLKRFRKIARALSQLVEQLCVLDGDDSLRGEVLDKSTCLSVNGFTSEVDGDAADYFVSLSIVTTCSVRAPASWPTQQTLGRGRDRPAPP